MERHGWILLAPTLPTITPGDGRPRTLDYFAVCNPLLPLCKEVAVIGDSGIATHSPVGLRLKVQDKVDRLRVLKRPDPGSASPEFGPAPLGNWPECEALEAATADFWGRTASIPSDEVTGVHKQMVIDYWEAWCKEVDTVKAAIFGGDPPASGREYTRKKETDLARGPPRPPPLMQAWHRAALWWKRRFAELLQAMKHHLMPQAKAVCRVLRAACSRGGPYSPKDLTVPAEKEQHDRWDWMAGLGEAVLKVQAIWGRPWGHQAAIRTVEAAAAAYGEAVRILGKEAAAASKGMWKDWVEADELRGARGAHRFSKVPHCPSVPIRRGHGGHRGRTSYRRRRSGHRPAQAHP
jgi:hypothetical protein